MVKQADTEYSMNNSFLLLTPSFTRGSRSQDRDLLVCSAVDLCAQAFRCTYGLLCLCLGRGSVLLALFMAFFLVLFQHCPCGDLLGAFAIAAGLLGVLLDVLILALLLGAHATQMLLL